MPLYEYLCRDCDNPAELLIRGDEKPVCPECGGEQLMKLLSVPAAPSGGGSPRDDGPPPGSCGSGCACFPGG
ncbi:Zinc ribbon domain protein [Posidoniimonas corsicana]|uniref:Zinc ribbon domain protein n=1 Tax=Posidoniimonas corsicana TaxID=1938618 RepID=A0A5C5V312_9BACT|nr:zinc ribbon domain-containing protein [Posidoniimonas corsicana]TWT32333.1 Zinc ribbon domain protein [Posidoniimonas corsicana]